MIDETRLIERLVKDEDEILHCYLDSLGYQTIGVGRLIDKRKGGGISQEESRYLLRNDIAAKTAEARKRFPWFDALDDARQGVILCMCFQLGTKGVVAFTSMISAIRIRDYVSASLEMLDSHWAQQTPKRAERLARIMKTGQWE